MSINPYKWITGLYTEEAMVSYHGKASMIEAGELAPHLFGVADHAYSQLVSFFVGPTARGGGGGLFKLEWEERAAGSRPPLIFHGRVGFSTPSPAAWRLDLLVFGWFCLLAFILRRSPRSFLEGRRNETTLKSASCGGV